MKKATMQTIIKLSLPTLVVNLKEMSQTPRFLDWQTRHNLNANALQIEHYLNEDMKFYYLSISSKELELLIERMEKLVKEIDRCQSHIDYMLNKEN